MAAETIACPKCGKEATYHGTQDRLAIYVCPDQHLSQIKQVDKPVAG